MLYKVPLILSPQPEGGFTVTSPLLPELVTEGDTVDEALANVQDALAAVVEAYEDLGRPLPANTQLQDVSGPVWLETLVAAR
ncbi:MAG TPA: type II toxin-antitoxin system HicB family antitoxin [Thermoanaerobaculia bacterium]|jgi:antitoxin HicB|nr:type II toxin-antitoxin system HicB family antitoxin [Thermoanaerobaculia bacterium]